MSRPVRRGTYRRSCRRCAWTGTYDTKGRADYAKRRHSCTKALRRAALAERGRARMAAVDRTPKRCLHKYADHQHGTYACYVLDACRCERCCAARSAHETDRVRLQAYGRWDNLVDAEPARQHIRALMDAGMGLKRIVALGHASQGQLWKLLYGLNRADGTRRPPAKRIRKETAARLLAIELDLADGAVVDGKDTARRLQALVAMGWSASKVGVRLGVEPTNMSPLLHGTRGVTVATAKAVHRLYLELAELPPPESNQRDRIAAARARHMAEANGWAPPLRIGGRLVAGNALPEPKAHPQDARGQDLDAVEDLGARRESVDEEAVVLRVIDECTRPRQLTPAEADESVRRLLRRGHSATEIANVWGFNLNRYGSVNELRGAAS